MKIIKADAFQKFFPSSVLTKKLKILLTFLTF